MTRARAVLDATDIPYAKDAVNAQSPASDGLIASTALGAYRVRDAQRCPACGHRHSTRALCAAMKDALWAVLRDAEVDPGTKVWARGKLGIGDADVAPRPRRRRVTSNTCGWAEVAGAWRCVADHHAGTGSGVT